MKLKIAIALKALLFITICGYSQNTFESLMQEGQVASEQGKHLIAALKFKKASGLQPLNENALIQLSWSYLLLKNYDEARKFARRSYYLNQSNASVYAIMGYVALAKGESGADQHLQSSVDLSSLEDQLYFKKDFQDIRNAGLPPDIFSDERLENYFSAKKNSHEEAMVLFSQINGFYEGNVTINQVVEKVKSSTISIEFKSYYIKLFSEALAQSGFYNEAKSLIIEGKKLSISDNITQKYIQTSLITSLMRINNINGNYEEAISYFSEIDEANWEKVTYLKLGHPLADSWLMASQAYNGAGQIDNQELVARKLMNVTGTYQDAWYQANGHNSLGTVKLNSSISSDRSAARSSLQTALNIAENNDFTQLIPSIASNLAISYWQHGMQEEAKNTYIKLSKDAIARDRYLDAELYLNNLATLYFYNKDYRNAAKYFQESIDLIEQHRSKVSPDSRITFLQARQSSYTFLTSCLVKLGDKTGLFRAQESQRARLLADQLRNNKPTLELTLAQFQKTLAPDQAAVYYTLMEPGAVVIHVVTSNGSYAVRHEAFDQFIAFKNKYLARIKSSYKSKEGFKPAIANRVEGGVRIRETDKARLLTGEDFEMLIEFSREILQKEIDAYTPIRKDFLAMLHSLLIAPIQSQIQSKRTLLISPDGLLNFIPFETLASSSGRYLAETHELSYMQSGEVYRTLLERNYSNDRKGMIAFGGATYDKMNIQSDPIRGARRLNEVKLSVDQKLLNKQSLRAEYAAIGFGKMNYLPGTLAEVNGLSQIVPNSTVYRGSQFDESFIKQLSKEGKLAEYRVVHFATHGFSLPMVPALSGIATCIYPEEKNGEDGYLNVNEITQLNLKADLAVLSACETGLGKIYGGEGVFGLTQALLVAGANEAAVSLWPVSDQGTMYFMKGMYALVEEKGMNYSEAMAEMKRQFIAGRFGERFKHPVYWAPFIHYGRAVGFVKATAPVKSVPVTKIAAPQTTDATPSISYHEKGITEMVLSPNKKLVATGGKDDRILIWDAETLMPVKEIKLPFDSSVKGLYFNQTGTKVYLYSGYNELFKYEMSSGSMEQVLPKGKGDVTKTREWEAGKEIMVVKNHIIEFMDLESGKVLEKLDFGETGYVADFIKVPEEDKYILSFVTWGHPNDRIEIYKLSTKEKLRTIKTEAVDIYYDRTQKLLLAIQARGNYAVKQFNWENDEMKTLDVDKGSTLIMLGEGQFMTKKHPLISPEGIHHIQNVKDGEIQSKIQLKGYQFKKVVLSDHRLLVMDPAGKLRILDTKKGELIK
ncbi:MAG: CHAT domain-containing protein [bacterium]|nr:CHAT domain-containing protein [bacterium]